MPQNIQNNPVPSPWPSPRTLIDDTRDFSPQSIVDSACCTRAIDTNLFRTHLKVLLNQVNQGDFAGKKKKTVGKNGNKVGNRQMDEDPV